jgi:hypothetical protein
MQAVPTPAAAGYRCTNGKGLWFDLLDDEDQQPHAEAIDIGEAEPGAVRKEHDRINGPRCKGEPMIRMVDPKQPHIGFESCTIGYDRFDDAGEFRDPAEYGFADVLKRFKLCPRN